VVASAGSQSDIFRLWEGAEGNVHPGRGLCRVIFLRPPRR
jgi:hypothetical protein